MRYLIRLNLKKNVNSPSETFWFFGVALESNLSALNYSFVFRCCESPLLLLFIHFKTSRSSFYPWAWLLICHHCHSFLHKAIYKHDIFFHIHVGLRGSRPRFRVSCAKQQNPTLLTLSVITRVAHAIVSPKAILGDDRTRFLHPEVYVMCFYYS